MVQTILVLTLCQLIFVSFFAKNSLGQLYLYALVFIVFILTVNTIEAPSQLGITTAFFLLLSNFVLSIVVLILALIIAPRDPIRAHRHAEAKALIFAVLSVVVLIVGTGGISNILGNWIQVGENLAERKLLRGMAILLYFLSLASLYTLRGRRGRRVVIFTVVTILALFVIIVRIKIFFLPILLVCLLSSEGISSKIKIRSLFALAILFPVVYLITMIVRWEGSLGTMTLESLYQTTLRVLDAGIERELFKQFTSVMHYYQGAAPLWGDTWSRLVLLPIDKIFATSLAPENPMYTYYTIANNGVEVPGGSAHPTVYADSFANFGWLGVFVPAIYYLSIELLSRFISSHRAYLLFMSCLMSVPLIARGSVYYGLLYISLALFFSILYLIIRQLARKTTPLDVSAA